MPADPSRPGRFLLDLPSCSKANTVWTLIVPQSANETFIRTFHGVVPKLEDENPQRNAALLREIAKKTDGVYYPDLRVALSNTATPSLVDLLKDVSHTDRDPAGAEAGRRRNGVEMDVIRLVRRCAWSGWCGAWRNWRKTECSVFSFQRSVLKTGH